MGSAGNIQFTSLRSANQRERDITATATIRTGRPSDDFVIDNPVNVVSPEDDTTLTIPDGIEVGQRLNILFSADANSKTVTVTTTTGDDGSLTAAGDFVALEWFGSTSGWQKLSHSTET
jgi:hypothetical protein